MPLSKRSTSMQLSPGQADYVLNSLLADRQITRWQVQGALSKMEREIEELELRLALLRSSSHNGRTSKTQSARQGNTNGNGKPSAKAPSRRRKARVFSP